MAKLWLDNFTRSNGDLDGDTLSGGGATWDSPSGFYDIVSNQLVMTGLVGEAGPTATVATESDTDVVFAEIAYTLALGSGTYISVSADICLDFIRESGYSAFIATDGQLNVFALSTFALVDQALGQPSSGVLRIERRHSTGEISVYINGTRVLGPTVDTSQSYGSGFRYVGISAYTDVGDGSESATLTSFSGGDTRPALLGLLGIG